jgi:hypothetical protein
MRQDQPVGDVSSSSMPTTADLPAALLDLLHQSPLPLTLAEVVKQLRVVVGAKVAKKEAVLAALAGLKSARALPVNPRKLAELSYTVHEDAAVSAHLLEQWVRSAKKPLKLPDLRKKLAPVLQAQFNAVFEGLLAQQRLFLLPKAVPLVLATRPSARDLIDAATLRRLRLLVQQVNAVRSSELTVEGLIEWLDGSAHAPVAESSTELTPELLREWYEADASRSSTRMVPLPQTWAHYAAWADAHTQVPELQRFRSMIERLYNEGQIWLEPCEYPQDLPEEERALLVPLAIGPPGFAWSWASLS